MPRTLRVAEGTAKRHGRGSPFLLTFFGEAKKVSRPPGRDPASYRSEVTPAKQTPSLLPQGNHKGCPYALIPHPSLLAHGQPQGLPLHPHSSPLPPRPRATTRVAPTPSFLTPPSSHRATTRVAPTPSFLTPHSSLLIPHPSFLTPHPSPLTPHSTPLKTKPIGMLQSMLAKVSTSAAVWSVKVHTPPWTRVKTSTSRFTGSIRAYSRRDASVR